MRLLVSVTSNQGVARGSQLIAQKSRKGDRFRRRVAAGVTEYNNDASDRTATREDAPSFVLSAVLLDTLAPAASYPGTGHQGLRVATRYAPPLSSPPREHPSASRAAEQT